MSMTIYYDGECPFCTRYVRLLRLRETTGAVDMVNIREDDTRRIELEAQGFDLDQGMVVDRDGARLGGADAVNLLALLSTPSGAFNRLNRALLGQPWLAAILYPLLRAGRWFTLFLLGRRGINADEEAIGRHQMLFGCFFAMFSLFHVYNYYFAYMRYALDPDLIAVFAAALFLLARPSSPRALFLLMLAATISTIAQAPAQSNHTMLRTALLIGYWASFLLAWVRSRPIGEIFANFAYAGRGALLVMYVFGIFHKINTDFLNPETSCAMALWNEMPAPLSLIQGYWMEMFAIYGTFAIEGAIMVALIFARTRYLGLVAGIGFHLMLALSDYAAYTTFTTLSICCHVLFLGQTQTTRIATSPEMVAIRGHLERPAGALAFLALLASGAFAMSRHDFTLAALLLLPFVLPLCYLILRYGHEDQTQARKPLPTAGLLVGALAAGLYFVSAMMPYFGLKTAQSINMFANLRLEAGVSNHLVFSNPPGPWTYLEDVAVITDPGDSAHLADWKKRDFAIVYYDLLAQLADNPSLVVSYQMNGQTFTDISAADRAEEIAATLHHPFIRKWFHFLPVQLQQPEPCTL